MIDTLSGADAGSVLAALGRLDRPPTELKQIVLSRGHRSHLGGLATLKRLSGATVYAHEWEADIVAGQRQAQAVGFWPPQPLGVWWPTYPLQLGLSLGFGRHPPCPGDRPVADGDRVGPLRVLHTPGHSPGHLAFWGPERRALFAGDALATWPVLAPGWPAFNLNPKRHRASLAHLADLDAETLAVGHGEPIASDAGVRVRELAADPDGRRTARRTRLTRQTGC